MRLALVIVSLAAIAIGMVHIRRCEMAALHESQRLRDTVRALRRQQWDQQVRLGYLVAPAEVRRRADQFAIRFVPPQESADSSIRVAANAAGRR